MREIPKNSGKFYPDSWQDIHQDLAEFDKIPELSIAGFTDYVQIIAGETANEFTSEDMKDMAYTLFARVNFILAKVSAEKSTSQYHANLTEGNILTGTINATTVTGVQKESQALREARVLASVDYQVKNRELALYKVMETYLEKCLELLNNCQYGYNVTLKNLLKELAMTHK